ncbi:sulfite exporter TauE/SafE family protein [Candidatus Nitronereus thalassa]|uniref:Probable membrane transporter protein n=1 Tax=Candidatus Nitronereus thalassa TaxID=3020898 RepID=A0ABU3K7F4_9BACT|nr:sulfite exporter TauE/SafE family protein [Candidatus Nitronereus thalassa]MDT7042374.1 sulfite exporter TauE/SafE family protein [Candidatus Nitronereus thalassa]
MDLQTFLALLTGGVVGIILGATGAGGSILAIPLLVYLVGVPVQEATLTSLVVVGCSSLLGVLRKNRDHHVKGRAALVFSSTGLLGAWVGAFGHTWIQENTILLLFGVLMVGVSVWSLVRRNFPVPEQVEGCAREFSLMCVGRALSIGFGVGILTGFFGIGGGFLIVPALIGVLGFPAHYAVGTSLMIIALTTVGGILGHLEIASMELGLTAIVVAGSVLGIFAGISLSKKIDQRRFATVFGMMTGIIGTGMILETLHHVVW